MISMKAYELINSAAIKLKQKNILSYKLDSEILLSKALGKKREEILINLDQKVNYTQSLKFSHLINRRASSAMGPSFFFGMKNLSTLGLLPDSLFHL